jgi:hypothetical protein
VDECWVSYLTTCSITNHPGTLAAVTLALDLSVLIGGNVGTISYHQSVVRCRLFLLAASLWASLPLHSTLIRDYCFFVACCSTSSAWGRLQRSVHTVV